ncbi:MAG: phosphatidylserine decarboxylase family protein [Alphaproteobacteria bacterium]|nr:MAG: phosphatidylserine decarboxylase family protein [Alphaproteobacteria bacterium]
MTIHKEGRVFVILGAICTVYAFLEVKPFFYPLFIITIWIFYFFRNPQPHLPVNEKVMVSPASGKVVLIQDVVPPKDYDLGDGPVTRVSIFLNIFDVHVNRSPVTGTILKTIYKKGQFLNAAFDRASEVNESNTTVIEYKGKKMAVKQIAGVIARRIVCSVEEGQGVEKGEELGIIRFGSRVDLYFHKVVKPYIQVGQKVRVGETAIYEI